MVPLIALAAQLVPFLLPKVAGALGGSRAVKVAETVVEIAEAVTGAKGQDAVDAVRKNPETALAFLQAQMAADTKFDEIMAADRADARARDRAFVKAGRKNYRADVMVVCDVLGLVACLIVLAVFYKDLPGEATALISTVASIFGLCLRDAHQFEFGSSRSSRDKDEIIQRNGHK
jgi:hypothetical protein